MKDWLCTSNASDINNWPCLEHKGALSEPYDPVGVPHSFVWPCPVCSKKSRIPCHSILLNHCPIYYQTLLNLWFIKINILLLLCYKWSVSQHPWQGHKTTSSTILFGHWSPYFSSAKRDDPCEQMVRQFQKRKFGMERSILEQSFL